MPIYRFTMGFAGLNQGWSETHQWNATATRATDLIVAAQTICQKRANLLGSPFFIVAFRISKYLDGPAGPRSARAVAFVKQRFSKSSSSGTGPAEPADVALIMRGSTNPGDQVNQTFLGAPSDAAVSDGGAVDTGMGNLGANFNAYAQALIAAQFGWGISTTEKDLQINGVTSLANGRVEITVPAGTFVGPFPGKFVPGRIRQVNAGHSPLNGQVIVQPTAADKLVTREVIGLALDQEGGFIRVYSGFRPYVPYTALTLELEVGNHKRGRPFGSPAGRQKNRVRG